MRIARSDVFDLELAQVSANQATLLATRSGFGNFHDCGLEEKREEERERHDIRIEKEVINERRERTEICSLKYSMG